MNTKLVLIIVAGIALTSCQKKSTTDYGTLGQDTALSQSVSGDVFKNADTEAKSNSTVGKKEGTYQSRSTCAVVTFKSTNGSFPDTLVIDFGTGCYDINDGKTRKGQIICAFTGHYSQTGTVVTVTTNNYYVNGYKVEGVKTITNMGRTNGNLVFNVTDQNGKVTKPDGGIVTWASSYTQTWTAGESTPLNICDDVYSIVGTASGTGSKGDSYSLEADATNPLIKNICCYWLQSGILNVSVDGTQIATIDYSYSPISSSCDSWATLYYGGKGYNVDLY